MDTAYRAAFGGVSRIAFKHNGYIFILDTEALTATFQNAADGIAFADRITALDYGRPMILGDGRFVTVEI